MLIFFEGQGRDPIMNEPVGYVLLRDERAEGILKFGLQTRTYAEELTQRVAGEITESSRVWMRTIFPNGETHAERGARYAREEKAAEQDRV